MNNTGIALAACLLLSAPAAAQQAAPTPAVAPATAPTPSAAIIPPAPVSGSILRAGTKVPLKMAEELTTKGKKLRVGQRFQLEVAEDIRLNDAVVIPGGTPATGEITEVRNKGMWGKSGRIGAQLLYLRVNGRQIRLTGTFDDKGVTGTVGVVGAAVLIPVAGFFLTGTSARLPLGGAVGGFLDEDVPVQMNLTAPAPLVVSVPQPATVATTAVTTASPPATAASADKAKAD